ncbi:MAG: UDP-2,3-diacylglucosamine diphosphatase [Bacteroidetes bacterium]|nr:MAG: UDP-2,3-diacylglucosamine diphosphatase [Bacteroidota bacterium]
MKPVKIPKREVDIVVISDVHLGTVGCRAKELLQYLRSVRFKTLILNGDIIDMWHFRKNYFPKFHLMVIRYFTGLIAKKTRVIYITGNHDELLRKFVKFKMGSFELVNKVLLDLDGRKAWIFHGDVFDVTMQYSKWLAVLGGVGYTFLILFNNFVNLVLISMGREKISFSKKIKERVKSAVAYINKFEETAAGIAISKGYSFVICGHIHKPEIRTISNNHGEVLYLNSGDWVENLSALEYNKGQWEIYQYQQDEYAKAFAAVEKKLDTMTDREVFENLLKEFNLK